MIKFDDFIQQIEEGEACDYLVRIRLKYEYEKEARETNELLLFEPCGMPDGRNFGWYRDWHEGEEYFEIVGYIKIHEIEIPEKSERRHNERNQIL